MLGRVEYGVGSAKRIKVQGDTSIQRFMPETTDGPATLLQGDDASGPYLY